MFSSCIAGARAVVMMRGRIDIHATTDELLSAAGEEVVRLAAEAIRLRGACSLALSGGETPRGLYRKLAALPESDAPDWSSVHLCFGDERMVPPDSPESNYGMVRDELIAHVPIPAGNVHRIRGERPPAVASAEYAAGIERVFSRTGGAFDLVLLGLGEDGHTASLFPGTNVLGEKNRTVSEVFVPKLSAWRVTLTLPVINTAREVLFLVSGARKAEIVRRLLEAETPTAEIPATLVSPAGSLPHWMLDGDAAGSLRSWTGISGV